MKKTFDKNKPRVSIGMPVFNGEEYIEEALDSILAQTYPDFELIISDNASTDRTPKICREYATRDDRIHYHRNDRNLGASTNFNRVFELSSGDYFKWVAYDDLLHPEFLSKCVDILDQDPSIVLCHSKTRYIGDEKRTYNSMTRISSDKPHERFGDLISFNHPNLLIFGLIRANSLRKTTLMRSYIGSDRNLLAEIGLIGRIYKIPEYLFFYRRHEQAYSTTLSKGFQKQMSRWQIDWWNPRINFRLIYTYNFLEYFRSIKNVQLKWSERLLCYVQMGKWLLREGYILIGSDVKISLLNRSSIGRKLASAMSKILRRFERLGC